MQYACGDCYTQYRVLGAAEPGEVVVGTRKSDSYNAPGTPYRFIGWDLIVIFKGSDDSLTDFWDRHYSDRQPCGFPVFRLTGQFKRKLIYALLYNGDMYDGIYFDADTAVAVYSPYGKCTYSKKIKL